MKYRSLVIFAIVFFLLFLPLTNGVSIPVSETITAEQSQQILQRILDRSDRVFNKYRGIESLRITTTEFFDAKTGELEDTESVKYVQKSYFYEVPETSVIEYKKNGKLVDPSEYDVDDDLPGHQIFDKKSGEHFDITVTGRQRYQGQDCYVLEVLPRQLTRRHFKGTVLVGVDSLALVYLEGTIADYPFGLKQMNMTFSFESLGELSAFTKATVELLIHVPIIKPNTRILVETLTLENKPIFR